MKFEISFERVYPHSPERVWRALTDQTALGEWLMETDFVPEVGRRFTMWCDDGAGGTDTYSCALLEYDPPRRMLWSWKLEGPLDLDQTLVEFRVVPENGGTKVTISHSGDRGADVIEKFKSGWPTKIEQLATVLEEMPADGSSG